MHDENGELTEKDDVTGASGGDPEMIQSCEK